MKGSSTFPPPPLTHRFTALYQDGSTFEQPPDDHSETREGGSAFSDVRVPDVKCFFLESGAEDDPGKHLYMVDLTDGHFEIDGCAFAVGPEEHHLLPPGASRRLLYFRRVAHTQETQVESGKVVRRSTARCYHLGWEIVSAAGEVLAARTIEVGHETFRVE